MSDIQFADKRIYPKLELTYGTDSVPTAAEIVRTRGVTFKNYEGNKQQQAYDGDGGRFRNSVNVEPHSSMSFDMDFAGSGTKDVSPNYKDILLSCGVNVVESVGVDTVFTPITSAISDSLSMYFVRNEAAGMGLAKSLGMRGEIGLEIKRGEVPIWKIAKMLGSYIQPAFSAAPLAGTPSPQLKGIPVTTLNTPTVTLDTQAVCLESFTLDNVGHQVEFLNAPNCNEAKSQPVPITGSMTIKDEGYATKNWLAVAESHAGVTQVPLNIVHGTVTGNILTLADTDVQITDIDETELNGLKAWNLSLAMLAVPVVTQT